ncbi:hypothetical protein Moror_13337, partial [Moniliophthora roreri MCA 2997]
DIEEDTAKGCWGRWPAPIYLAKMHWCPMLGDTIPSGTTIGFLLLNTLLFIWWQTRRSSNKIDHECQRLLTPRLVGSSSLLGSRACNCQTNPVCHSRMRDTSEMSVLPFPTSEMQHASQDPAYYSPGDVRFVFFLV